MRAVLFLLAALNAALAYAAIGVGWERWQRGSLVRRLARRGGNPAGAVADRQPRLIRSDDRSGRLMATRALQQLRMKPAVERLLETAALKWGAAGLLHRSAALWLAGFLAITIAAHDRQPWLALAAGLSLSVLPLAYVRRRASARIGRFEEQFPDCLEFLSRSMRAGHAFSVALEIVHQEFADPLASEMRRTFEEQNLGQPLDVVLRKLAERIPSLDVSLFVSAVLLQKRTGGNLAELLDKLAHIIRDRFKLRARVRAVSAQGIMSGRILSAIPAGVAVLMFLVNPRYARFFVDDPMGHEMVAAGLGVQFVGYLIIRKIVHIEA
ncbi:MAG TPA: type II secretion system F family protein [Bryobacteraceae bacterium]|nr:type II secretion system F family protein [Bryobacteraceae bacterium]